MKTVKNFNITLICFVLLTASALCASVSKDLAEQVASNWPEYVGLKNSSSIVDSITIPTWIDNDILYVVHYRDSGWAIVPQGDNLPPVYAYSSTGRFPDEPNPAINTLIYQLSRDINSMTSLQPDIRDSIIQINTEIWSEVEQNIQTKAPPDILGPLCTSAWHQSYSYNEMCPAPPTGLNCGTPIEPNDECPVGCVATAMSQIMYYWEHPTGYDWNNMQDRVNHDAPQNQIDAVAELCSDAGISVGMSYCDGNECESGANSSNVPDALVDDFGFWGDALYQSSSESIVMKELDNLRPVYIRGTSPDGGHAWICDGYDVSGSVTLYHWNMGWGSLDNVWRTINLIPDDFEYEDHVCMIAPSNIAFACDYGNGLVGSPIEPYQSLETAIYRVCTFYPGKTVIVEAGTNYPGSYTIDCAMTIKGENILIGK